MTTMHLPNTCGKMVVVGLNLTMASAVWGQTIGFQRESEVGVVKLTVKAGQKPVLFEGVDSCVSPDAEKLEGLSSATKMVMSPDGKSAVVAMEVAPGPGDEFPPTAIFHLDLETGKTVRLSAKGVEVADPSWLPDGKSYLFSVFGEVSEIHQAQARVGAASKRVLENAVQPSAAARTR